MPKNSSDKFLCREPEESGFWKRNRLLTINRSYAGDENVTLEDLTLFMKEKGLNPSDVKFSQNFAATIPVG